MSIFKRNKNPQENIAPGQDNDTLQSMTYDHPPMEELNTDSESVSERFKDKEYIIVSYFFVGIFVVLIGWLVYFNVCLSDEFVNSPYNKRQNTYAERVIRGQILANNGEVLAKTNAYEDGTELREYPYGSVFAHVVGYNSNGNYGIESIENFDLLTSHAFLPERIVNEVKGIKNIGDDIITTLDVRLQNTAWNALGASNGAVVVLEAKTGKILAMVSKPDFDPNTLSDNWEYIVGDDSSSVLVNRATQGKYPPGSTFKIITALAYYREHGSVDGFSFDCTGSIDPQNGHTIHCYEGQAHGSEDLPYAFAKSCNCAFAKIGVDLGVPKLKDASESLLFNKKLPIKFYYNQSSFTLSKKDNDAQIMQTAMGQGNTLTSPMHMALIADAIANDGVMMKPYSTEQIVSRDGNVVSKTTPSKYGRIMKEDEAGILKKLMTEVVSSGTGYALRDLPVKVAGKTGSAEYMFEGEMHTHSWFVGICNVDNPDIIVSVIVEGAGAGSEVAAPVAREIASTYYNQ